MKENKEQNGGSSSNNGSVEKAEELPRRWIIILFYVYFHIFGISGLYILFTKMRWITILYFLLLTMFSYIGLTIGAHRLYAHQTFVASTYLRFFLVLAHTISGVGSIHNWVLWHRLHHKYHDTDKDPYDHRKGFLYSHVLSNVQSAPSNLESYSKSVDMSDVNSDLFVWIQQKFYWILFIVFGFVLPVNITMVYLEESMMNSLLAIGAARLMIATHIAWLVNSALVIWGLKKGDRFPVNDNSVFFILKSYWPNYHYVIPWDWKNDEFGSYERGLCTFLIKIWYEMGLIKRMTTTTTEDVREILEKMAILKVPMKDALEELKQKSEDNAHKEALIFRF